MKAAIYARVSTKDKGQNPDNQLIPLRARAKEKGHTITQEYVEHESASGRVRRTQYLKMLQDAESGLYDVLLFWSLDRFNREGAAQTLTDLQRLTDADVLWVSLMDPIPDEAGPIRDIIISIMASLAKMETQRRSERAKAAIERRRKEGKPVGRQRRELPAKELLKLSDNYSMAALARHFGVSRGTVIARLEEMRAEECLAQEQNTRTEQENKKRGK